MNELWIVLSSYPTGIYSIFLGIMMVLWIFTILGAVDIDVLSVDIDLEVDTDIPGFAGLLHTLGLSGVPFTIVLTLLIFIAWVFTYVASNYIAPFIPTSFLQFIFSTAVLIGSFFVAIPITAKLIQPLKKLSAENRAKTNIDFLGYECRVTSQSVDEEFGQGVIANSGDDIIVRIRAKVTNEFKKGDIVRPISYEEKDNSYQVISNKEFENNL
ncbi:hypothetical protein [Marinicellulosiphila megalodicopiae]|uniref:hypothetical protein n=1 Tax=Marinicellulosiphila megalodicopiae TaxID=2724896 RepID=UPI003BB0DE92